jgi:hypothetical protein
MNVGMTIRDEFGRTLQEAIVANFKIIPKIL